MPVAGSDAVTAWVLTYLVHSTVFFLAAWILDRVSTRSHPRTKDVVWKTALLGGLVTASLQHGTAWEPRGGNFLLQTEAVVANEPPAPELMTLHVFPTPADAPLRYELLAETSAAPLAAAVVDPPAVAPSTSWRDWAPWGLGLWAAGALFGLVRWTRRTLALRRLLSRARRLEHGVAVELLADLRRRAGHTAPVRLVTSRELPSPISAGLARGVIALPERALHELSPHDLEGVLAHELAHVVRRDSLWLAVATAIESVFFFQPLHRLTRRRMHTAAEFLCDDWAVSVTRRSLSLARCLTQVAGWVLEGPPAVHAPAMAATAQLTTRVERLLADDGPRPAALPSWALLPLGFGATLLVAIAAPGVRTASVVPAPAVEPPTFPFALEERARILPVAAVPAARPAPAVPVVADSTGLLADLDVELDALDAELRSLRATLAQQGRTRAHLAQLVRIEQRRQALGQKRAELALLLAKLATAP